MEPQGSVLLRGCLEATGLERVPGWPGPRVPAGRVYSAPMKSKRAKRRRSMTDDPRIGEAFRHVHTPWLVECARQFAWGCRAEAAKQDAGLSGDSGRNQRDPFAAIGVEAFFNELPAETEALARRDPVLARLRDALIQAEDAHGSSSSSSWPAWLRDEPRIVAPNRFKDSTCSSTCGTQSHTYAPMSIRSPKMAESILNRESYSRACSRGG